MELDRIAAVLRPRTPWESVDHGFSLVQWFWRAVYLVWIPSLLVVWALVVLIFRKQPAWALLVVWWLRPVLERIPLFVLSRALFGAPPSPWEVVRALPGLLFRHLLPALLLFRLSPGRSLHLPVWELEGLRGIARWRRSAILAREVMFEASLLTLGMGLLEILVIFGLAAVGSFLFPERDVDFLLIKDVFSSESQARQPVLLLCVLFFLSQALLGPFYVAGGFALYIDRRTRLEGWDIEITFRNLARRLGGATVLLLVLTLVPGLAVADAGEESPPAGPGKVAASAPRPSQNFRGEETPESSISRVLSHPDFQTRRTVTRWVPRDWARKKASEGDEGFLASVEGISAVWSVLRPVLAVLLLAAFLVVLWRFARRAWEERPVRDVRARGKGPEARRGSVPAPEELPADISAASLRAWREGRAEEALSLLYRGVVSRLVLEGVPLTSASTESDCVEESARRGPPRRADYVRQIVRAWQGLAYAHRCPSDEQGTKLCEGYDSEFAPRGGAS